MTRVFQLTSLKFLRVRCYGQCTHSPSHLLTRPIHPLGDILHPLTHSQAHAGAQSLHCSIIHPPTRWVAPTRLPTHSPPHSLSRSLPHLLTQSPLRSPVHHSPSVPTCHLQPLQLRVQQCRVHAFHPASTPAAVGSLWHCCCCSAHFLR